MNLVSKTVGAVLSFAAIGFLTACAIPHSYQPLPPMFQNWGREGAVAADVKQALLICGYDNPYTGFDARKGVELNYRAQSSKCMRDAGFFYLLGNGSIICDQAEWRRLPACISDRKVTSKNFGGRPISPEQCYGKSSEDACMMFWKDSGGFPVMKRISAN